MDGDPGPGTWGRWINGGPVALWLGGSVICGLGGLVPCDPGDKWICGVGAWWFVGWIGDPITLVLG
jgi:hypothetical protein